MRSRLFVRQRGESLSGPPSTTLRSAIVVHHAQKLHFDTQPREWWIVVPPGEKRYRLFP
jgi:hypothetical protein